jgi:hypothetical protein
MPKWNGFDTQFLRHLKRLRYIRQSSSAAPCIRWAKDRARGQFQTFQAFNSAQTAVTWPDATSGCVRLLGAVQITEGPVPRAANMTLSYTVPVFNNSAPVPGAHPD